MTNKLDERRVPYRMMKSIKAGFNCGAALEDDIMVGYSFRTNQLIAWHLFSQQQLATTPLGTATLHDAKFTAMPGNRVAVSALDFVNKPAVRVFQLSADSRAFTVAAVLAGGHDKPALCLAYMPSTGCLASGGMDGTICVWRVDAAPGLLSRIKAHRGWVTALCALPDGGLVSASTDLTLRVWSPAAIAAASLPIESPAPVTLQVEQIRVV